MSRRQYRLLRGVKTRMENGVPVTYTAGDVILLDDREAEVLRFSVEMVEQTASPPANDTTTWADGHADEALSRIEVAQSQEALDEIERIEEANKHRITVLRAVEARREELEEE